MTRRPSVITYHDRTWTGQVLEAKGIGDVLVTFVMKASDAWSLREATTNRNGSHAMRIDWLDHAWSFDGTFIELDLTDRGEPACAVQIRLGSGVVTTPGS